MSKSSNRPWLAAASLALALTVAGTQSSSAAIEETSPRVADLSTATRLAKAGAAAPDGARDRSALRNVLRCWQYGRLIYEGRGLVPSDRSAAAPIKGDGGGSIHFFDLHNATCILEQAGG